MGVVGLEHPLVYLRRADAIAVEWVGVRDGLRSLDRVRTPTDLAAFGPCSAKTHGGFPGCPKTAERAQVTALTRH